MSIENLSPVGHFIIYFSRINIRVTSPEPLLSSGSTWWWWCGGEVPGGGYVELVGGRGYLQRCGEVR